MVSGKLAGLLAMAGVAMAAPATGASLFVQSGQLGGVNGLAVNGSIYDVRFVDGRCTEIYGGCDQPNDFDFASGSLAGVALGALGNFLRNQSPWTHDPERTRGCADSNRCYWVVPYALSSGYASARLWANVQGGGDYLASTTMNRSHDTRASATYVYARFFDVTPAVPEPSTWLMMLTAFLGVGMALRNGARRAALA